MNQCKYMNCCGIIIKRVLMAFSLVMLVLAGLLVMGGAQFSEPLGKLLFEINPIYINLPQAIIQRYIWADLWLYIVPILKIPAYLVFLVGFISPIILLTLTRLVCKLCQKCQK